MFPQLSQLVTSTLGPPWQASRGVADRRLGLMTVREDCRHYSSRTVSSGDVVQRCKVDFAATAPFACPEDCLFFESRVITDASWRRGPDPQG